MTEAASNLVDPLDYAARVPELHPAGTQYMPVHFTDHSLKQL